MTEQVNDPLHELYPNTHKIKIPYDLNLRAVYNVYVPSFQTINFLSENERKLFSEACVFEKDSNKKVKKLQCLALEILAKNYNGKKIDERIMSDNLVTFGELCDVDLPLENLIELECDTFWRRVVEQKSQSSLFYHNLKNNSKTSWKREGIQLKLAELIEQTSPKDWDLNKLLNLAEKASPFTFALKIRSMKPMKKHEHKYTREQMDNVPIEVCHHGTLCFLKNLINLQTLAVRFSPGYLGRNYKTETYQHSYEDIENLALGINNLSSLKVLKITDSRMDMKKIDILLNSIESVVELVEIDFSNCNLNGESCIPLGLFIGKSSTLKRIELQGNNLNEQGIRCVAYGLQNTKSKEIYLGLARNPITNDGIKELGKGLYKGKNVTELNISGVDISGVGTYTISHILDLKVKLKKLNISGIKFSKNAGDELIMTLRENYYVIKLECRNCGLEEKQEFDINLLTKRNQYYNEHPYMLKNSFAAEDESQIEACLKRLKHPILLKIETEDSKKLNEISANNLDIPFTSSNNLQEFIIESTPELLGLKSRSYAELFKRVSPSKTAKEPKSIIKSHTNDTKKIKSKEKELAEQMRIVTSNDLKEPFYF